MHNTHVTMGILNTTRNLASLWVENKKLQLEQRGKPNTKVDSGGSKNSYTFDGQEITTDELREVRDMRETGGIISQLVHAKALMQFGTGASFQAENDAAAEWLHDQFQDLDNLLIEIGEDATWFPAGYAEIVETRGGDFSHVEMVEPWTMLPVEDEYGDVIAYEQQISGDYNAEPAVFEPDEIAAFVLNKCSGRDKTGISDVLQAEDEIRNFKEDQETVSKALQYLVPHNHWKVGREGGTVIDDNELRRVRNMVNDMEGDTQFITGRDVDHEEISLSKFDIKEITNNDLRQVCVALGVPIELASVISEGLGSGEQSGIRKTFFDLEKRAKQRALGGQFVEQIARPLLEQYSPYEADQQLDLVFEETEGIDEKKQKVDAIGDDMTVNERRSMFDLAELDDEEQGEQFESPGGGDDEMPGGGGGGFFSDGRSLASVPDNAVSIDSPSECDGNVVEGPQGGMYCVPENGGGDDSNDSSTSKEDATGKIDEIVDSDMPDDEKKDGLASVVSETADVDTVDFDGFDVSQSEKAAKALVALGSAGQTDGIQEVSATPTDAMKERSAAGNYDPFSQTIRFDPDTFTEEKAQEWGEQGYLAGDDLNHMVAHEVGHHRHFQNEVDGKSAGMQAQAQEIPDDAKSAFAEEFSLYGAQNPNELVAEAYAVQAAGGELSTGVKNAYEMFNGPEVQ